jgi:nucleoside 2-deoxyribosyltransferase
MLGPVYLAGGMHDNWRQRFVSAFSGVTFFDPTAHGLRDEAAYTAWDLEHIDLAATVIGYMDATNPSGYGLNLELGYAKAKGKRVIFIDETDATRTRYFGMARQIADVVFRSLDDAVATMSVKGTDNAS